jgi:hypothetical protein
VVECSSLRPGSVSFLAHAHRQGILAAVLSALLGSKDPEQVATMAKQAGEVSLPTNFLSLSLSLYIYISLCMHTFAILGYGLSE